MSGAALPRADASLLARTAKGAGWLVAWRMATRALGLISTLLLVRLLAPGEFGLIALATAFTYAVDAVSYLGVEDALVREQAPGREMYDTAFTLKILRAAGTALVVAATARPAASFFGEPRLAEVLFVLAAATLFEGFGNIGVVDFRREMAFDKQFKLLALPRAAGVAAAITTAFVWRDHWALVAGIVCTGVLRVVLSYTMHPYRPRLTLACWRALAGFAFWTWVASLIVAAKDRGDGMIIARVLGPTELGFYGVGAEVAALPTTELIEPLSQACYSAFAAARHAGQDIAPTYFQVIATTGFVVLPAGVGLSLVADPLVKLAFGPQWLPAIPLIQVLGVAGVTTVMGYVSGALLKVYGYLRARTAIFFASAVVRLSLLLALIPSHGLRGVAVAGALATVADAALFLLPTFRLFHLRAADLLRATWRPMAATAAMTAVLVSLGLGWTPASGGALRLAAEVALASGLGALTYAAAGLAIWALAGRPDGPEAHLLRAARRLLARLAARLAAAARDGGRA